MYQTLSLSLSLSFSLSLSLTHTHTTLRGPISLLEEISQLATNSLELQFPQVQPFAELLVLASDQEGLEGLAVRATLPRFRSALGESGIATKACQS